MLIIQLTCSNIMQVRKLDDTEFRNPWARAYIRVICYASFFCYFYYYYKDFVIIYCCCYIVILIVFKLLSVS